MKLELIRLLSNKKIYNIIIIYVTIIVPLNKSEQLIIHAHIQLYRGTTIIQS